MAAVPFFRHRLRTALLIFLFANVILTCARQVFDLMGYVWSPIAANFLNVIFTIFAIFAAVQLRFRFFAAYICWTPFWLAWNIFLICYYLNIGVLNRDDGRPLSWGTGGRSWWARNTPGCQRTYNATSATVEIGECKYLPPYYVEVIQAAVHSLSTVIILISTIVFLFNVPRKLVGEPYSSLQRRRSTTNRPHVTVEIGPTPPVIGSNDVVNAQVNAADTSFARSSDVSSGYLNVSYDASPAARKTNGGPILANGNAYVSRPPPPQPLQNYRRNSNKRRSSGGGGGGGTGSVQRRTREKSRERIQHGQGQDLPALDHRLPRSTSADDLPPLPARSRSNSINGSRDAQADFAQLTDAIRTSSSRQSQRLSRPVQDIGDLLQDDLIPQPPLSRATTAEAADSKASSPTEEISRRQPIVRSYHRRDQASFEQSPGVIDYNMEPRRIGVASGVAVRQQVPSDPFRPANPVRRSVISFDPKSDSDTLLRFHDHLARSQETILSRASTSTQQPSQNRNPLTAPDVVSFDSGLPPSHGGGSDDDPRLSRDSQNLSTSFVRQQEQRKPVGYEPAFMMSYEPADSQDEPIYRPSFLKSGTSGQSPMKFRYHQEKFGKAPPAGALATECEYVQPSSLRDDNRYRPSTNSSRTPGYNGHAQAAGDSSGSESSSVAGLAVPRISNSSLLV